MPYFATHTIDTPPTTGRLHISRTIALDQRKPYQQVSCVLTQDEMEQWVNREYARFENGHYVHVPWYQGYDNDGNQMERMGYQSFKVSESGYFVGNRKVSDADANGGWKLVDGSYYYDDNGMRVWLEPKYPDARYQSSVYIFDPDTAPRFPHISLKQKGMIAYTPSAEWGHEDRQQIIRPGKYLEKFHPYVDKATRDQWCEEIRAFAEQTLQITRDADEIERLYLHGPQSCMSHRLASYSSDVHPVRVYGGCADTAVAYIGTLDNCKARCVVWPDKRIYTRVYGDKALTHLLTANGYTSGSLEGARVQAIRTGNTWVMPYVDYMEYACLTSDRRYFILTNDADAIEEMAAVVASYDAQQTNGVCDEDEVDRNTCEHCGDRVGRDETYCESCNEDRWSCDNCGEDYFTDDGRHNTADDADGSYCDSCWRRGGNDCAVCGDSWYQRNNAGNDLCGDCEDTHHWCAESGEYVNTEEHTDCTSCHEDEDEDITTTTTEDTSAPDETPATPPPVRPVMFTDCPCAMCAAERARMPLVTTNA
jgi:hypothetical protein